VEAPHSNPCWLISRVSDINYQTSTIWSTQPIDAVVVVLHALFQPLVYLDLPVAMTMPLHCCPLYDGGGGPQLTTPAPPSAQTAIVNSVVDG